MKSWKISVNSEFLEQFSNSEFSFAKFKTCDINATNYMFFLNIRLTNFTSFASNAKTFYKLLQISIDFNLCSPSKKLVSLTDWEVSWKCLDANAKNQKNQKNSKSPLKVSACKKFERIHSKFFCMQKKVDFKSIVKSCA
jgi:hypothetical protein